ncbi:MAG: nitronate monooxygenase [Tannerella sp.]|jgi:enoyl-[acyl-carrier protein] reductase II|nr:nitronate monooxygenase [Tannerella sp.]
MGNKVTELLQIKYPLIQGGMVWCSGWKLASAVSNNGGLGLLGAGSMHPELLREHIIKCKAATRFPFGVNVPLTFYEAEEIMKVIIDEGVKIVFSSAGNPKTWTSTLQRHGITVVHVVSGSRFAQKAEEAGVDALVAEGFEAGGHNGREETTTFTLIPQVRKLTRLPLIAAGGVGTGSGLLAAMSLGADGVQIGTRFALSEESSAHIDFKQRCINTNEGDTLLTLKKISPIRLIKNAFYEQVNEAEGRGAGADELQALLGRGRARMGIAEGDLTNGMLEIGQICAGIKHIEPVKTIIENILTEYREALERLTVL